MSKTRNLNRIFNNLACNVPFLGAHIFNDDEVPLFNLFLDNIVKSSAKKEPFSNRKEDLFSESGFFFTKDGSWYGKSLLFANNKQRKCYKNEIGEHIWEQKAVSISTAVKHFLHYKKNQNLPLAFFVGQKSEINSSFGHVWIGILLKNENWEILVKGPLPETNAGVPKNIQLIG